MPMLAYTSALSGHYDLVVLTSIPHALLRLPQAAETTAADLVGVAAGKKAE